MFYIACAHERVPARVFLCPIRIIAIAIFKYTIESTPAYNSALSTSPLKVWILSNQLSANYRRYRSDICLVAIQPSSERGSKQQNMVASKPLPISIASILLLFNNSATSLTLPTESADNSRDVQRRAEVTPLSVNDACKYEHGSDSSARAVGTNCNGWVCVRGNEKYGVDLRLWCEMSIGDGVCYTYASCSSSIQDWRCNCTIYILIEDC